MSFEILGGIESPAQLKSMDDAQLNQLANEIREALLTVVADRSAHFASNLGVVELCIALHKVFDFSRDRLIWDTGHQIYPHKLVTGRFSQMETIRRRGGLMGYPNPAESDYDLFVTGHAGSSVSTCNSPRRVSVTSSPSIVRRPAACWCLNGSSNSVRISTPNLSRNVSAEIRPSFICRTISRISR